MVLLKLQRMRSNLFVNTKYENAHFYVSVRCGDRESAFQALIRDLAQVKALQSRVGERRAQEFFGSGSKGLNLTF